MAALPISGPILTPTDPLVAVVVIATAAYLLPTVVLVAGHHPRRRRLLVTNLLLGWTVLAWAICLLCGVRAARRHEEPARRGVLRADEPIPA